MLVDTSVWIAHLRQSDPRLMRLVYDDDLVCHPYVITEIACSTPANRDTLIEALSEFEPAGVPTQPELRHFIRRQALHGRGCGMVDLALLASVAMGGEIGLWTLDKRLHVLASALGCAYAPPLDS